MSADETCEACAGVVVMDGRPMTCEACGNPIAMVEREVAR